LPKKKKKKKRKAWEVHCCIEEALSKSKIGEKEREKEVTLKPRVLLDMK
jgi:hypothetical protein